MADIYFTFEEAVQLLPWVKEKLNLVTSAAEGLEKAREELAALGTRQSLNGSARLQEQMAEKMKERNAFEAELQAHLGELSSRGIMVRDPRRGLIDFPSLRQGREVCLCYLLGEVTISYWHEADAGFAGRQPL